MRRDHRPGSIGDTVKHTGKFVNKGLAYYMSYHDHSAVRVELLIDASRSQSLFLKRFDHRLEILT